jgi:hypothetical protein
LIKRLFRADLKWIVKFQKEISGQGGLKQQLAEAEKKAGWLEVIDKGIARRNIQYIIAAKGNAKSVRVSMGLM